MERKIKMIIENCVCLGSSGIGKDAFDKYVDRMTKHIMDIIEKEESENIIKKTKLT